MPSIIKKKPGGRAWMVFLLLLCISIVVHMLGVPITLLNPAEASDTVSGSVLEGFSVPPAFDDLMLTTQTAAVVQADRCGHCPVLTVVLFHPPV